MKKTIVLLVVLISMLIGAGSVFAAHSSDSNVITPGFEACNVLNTYTLTVTQTGGPDPIYNVRIYNRTTANPFPDQKDFSCGAEPTGWVFKGFTSIGSNSYCEYETEQDPINPYTIGTNESLNFTFSINILSESVHPFSVSTIDTQTPIGFQYFSFPNITVDCTKPSTEKSPIGPFHKSEKGVEWIDSVTKINLTATDNPPHPSGVDETWYMNILAEDAVRELQLQIDPEKPCWEPDFCDLVLNKIKNNLNHPYFDGKWQFYKDPFNKTEESCHVLVYYSVDNVGNEEDMKVNCFFVDKTPPEMIKTVGDPKVAEGGIEELVLDSNPESPTIYVNKTWDCGKVVWDFELEDQGDPFCDYGHTEFGLVIGFSDDQAEFQVGTGQMFGAGSPPIYQECDGPSMDPPYGCWAGGSGPTHDLLPGIVVDNPGGSGEPGYGDRVFHVEIPMQYLNGGDFYWALSTYGGQNYGYCKSGYQDYPDTWNKWSGAGIYADAGLGDCWVRDHKTEITLDCVDPEPHPSRDEEVCYKISFDSEPYDLTEKYCDEDLELIEQEGHEGEWCCLDAPKDIIFKEDSLHDLEFFCRDAVDKKSAIDKEWFKVDSQPPIVEKFMFGDYYGDCPNGTDLEHGDCYVADNGDSGVEIYVKDDDTYGHAVGGVYCEYKLWWEDKLINDVKFSDYEKIIFEDDSTHILKIWCEDALGNSVHDEEEFLVDSTPPETVKRYGEPIFTWEDWCRIECDDGIRPVCDGDGCDNGDGCFEECLRGGGGYDGNHWYPVWINSNNNISLWSKDEKVGVANISWRNFVIENPQGWLACEQAQFCNPEFYARFVDGNIPWNVVGGNYTNFTKKDESCHVIEYFATDLLGNQEDPKWQCVFVDKTEPLLEKVVGEPSQEDFDRELVSEGNPEGIFHWVTPVTDITFTCTDQEPHPSEGEEVCFKVYYDLDGDVTEEYCNKYSGSPEDGFCCVPVDEEKQFVLNFNEDEDSVHDLVYFCRDAVEKATEIEKQWYKVDSTPPETNKSFDGPKHIVDGVEWIDGETYVVLNATDSIGPHDVGVNKTWYMNILTEDIVQALGLGVDPERPCREPDFCDLVLTKIRNNPDHPYFDGKWQFYERPFTKEEESCHVLVYYSVDNLGNVEDMQANCFFVDITKPVTTKRFEGPQFPEDNDHEGSAHWISTETNVTLNASDPQPHPSGVNATYWRNTLVGDTYCDGIDREKQDFLSCDNATGSGNWSLYTVPFQKQEESCHLIEYFSVDNVNKTEKVKRQCVFVDDTGPKPVKNVSEPKAQWTPGRNGDEPSYFYPEETQHCWDGTGSQIECWKVTMMTEIELECEDQGDHPVDHNRVCFKVGLDGDDATEDYCNNWPYDGEPYFGEMIDGYCCVETIIEEFMFKEETEHNLKYYCVDALDNKGDIIDEEKFKVEGTKFEIQINKKWNLISVPFVLLNDNPEIVFENIADSVQSVWAYDPLHEFCSDEESESGWCVWTPNPSPDNLKVRPGWGYWVLSNNSDTLVIGGSLMKPQELPPNKQIVEGWNLIGYYGLGEGEGVTKYDGPDGEGDSAYCALRSLVDTTIGYPRWSSLWTYWEPDNPNQWKSLDVNDDMDPGAGYWLEMDVEDVYTVSTVCGWWWWVP